MIPARRDLHFRVGVGREDGSVRSQGGEGALGESMSKRRRGIPHVDPGIVPYFRSSRICIYAYRHFDTHI